MRKNKEKILTCSAAKLAKMLGLSVPRIVQMVDEGVVIKISQASYDVENSVSNYVSKLRDSKKDRPVIQIEGIPDLDESKARKEYALAQKEEIKLAEMKLEVLPISEVEAREARIGAAVRAAITKQRSELPPVLEGLAANQIASIIDERNRALLEDLADLQSEFWERRDKLKQALENE
jgi:hypothetical protein